MSSNKNKTAIDNGSKPKTKKKTRKTTDNSTNVSSIEKPPVINNQSQVCFIFFKKKIYIILL